MKKRILGFIIACGVLSLSPARATPADSADISARKHFEEGNKGFNLGEFDRAVREYKAAYGARSDPAFLYNIAQAYRLWNQPAEALAFYRAFLRASPSTPLRKEIEEAIHQVESEIAQQKAPISAPPTSAVSPDKAIQDDARKQDAPRCTSAALALLAEGKVYQAEIEADSAKRLGCDIGDVPAKIEAAKLAQRREEDLALPLDAGIASRPPESKWTEEWVRKMMHQDAERCVVPSLTLLVLEGKFDNAVTAAESEGCRARDLRDVLASP